MSLKNIIKEKLLGNMTSQHQEGAADSQRGKKDYHRNG